MSIRLLIADDHAQVRTTLKMLLGLWKDFTVIGEADSGLKAIELTKSLQPDVVLMDLDMPNMDGVEATRILCKENPGIRILILTGSVDFERINSAVSAGAKSYILKTVSINEIGEAIHQTVANHPS